MAEVGQLDGTTRVETEKPEEMKPGMNNDWGDKAAKRKSKKSSSSKKKEKSGEDGTKKSKKSRKSQSKSKKKSTVESRGTAGTERSSSTSMHDPTLEAAGGERIAIGGADGHIANATSREDKMHKFPSFGTTEREQLDGAADIIREMEENKPSPVAEMVPESDHGTWRHPSQQSLGYASYTTPDPNLRNPRGPVTPASPAEPTAEASGQVGDSVKSAPPATSPKQPAGTDTTLQTGQGSGPLLDTKAPKMDSSSTGEETRESKMPPKPQRSSPNRSPQRSPKSNASGWTSTTSQEEEDSSSDDYDSKECGDNVGRMRGSCTDAESSWNFDGDDSVGSSVISDITYETLKQQHMMRMMASSSHGGGRRGRMRRKNSSRSNSLRNLENAKGSIMEDYNYDEGLSTPAVEALRALGSKPAETWENLEEMSFSEDAERKLPGQNAAMGQNLVFTDEDDAKKAHELLMMYLLSVGTDPTAAREIADNFTKDKKKDSKKPQPQAAARAQQSSSNRSGSNEKGRMGSMGRTTSLPTSAASGIEAKLAEAMGPTTRAAVVGTSAEASNSNPRGQRRQRWERFEQPGAVQMEGRAFGAAPRPNKPTVATLPPDPSSEDPQLGDQIESEEWKSQYVSIVAGNPIVAKVVDSEETSRDSNRRNGSDVVTAEATPLSARSLWKEQSVRRLAYLAIFLTVVVIIASTTSVYTKAKASAKADANRPTQAPTMQPTRIDDDMVDEVSKFSPAVLEEGTPQRRAIGWLSTLDESNVELNDDRFIQRYILVTLYYATNGDAWKDKEEWLSPNVHECEWGRFTIACQTNGYVNGLNFVNAGLVGSLPPEVGLLPQLTSLNVEANSLKGTLPSEIFQLNRLTNLEMQQNEFSGSIPTNIADVSLLKNLDLSTNKLESSLPDSIYDLTLLTTLNLASNGFSGLFSEPGLWRLKELVKLDLRRNGFEGQFPQRFGEIPKLQFIHFDHNRFNGSLLDFSSYLLSRQELTISHNQITGTLPSVDFDQLGSLTAGGADRVLLRKIDVTSNLLTGTIPLLVGLIESLEEALLSNNAFSGTFPVSPSPNIQLWPSIKSLKAAGNRLEGPLPTNFPNAEEITMMDFSDNQMSRGIPAEFGRFQKLQYLSLRNNPLGGSIPLEMALPPLRTLDLGNCSITGTIPSSFLRTSPTTLNLANNSITGTIPTETGRVTSLVSLRLEGNELSGGIPSELGKLEFLKALTLSDNKLVGTIPPQLSSLRLLEEFSVAGNNLEGDLPQGLCLSGLSIEDIGCDVGCSCCANREAVCRRRRGLRVQANVRQR